MQLRSTFFCQLVCAKVDRLAGCLFNNILFCLKKWELAKFSYLTRANKFLQKNGVILLSMPLGLNEADANKSSSILIY
jgi:hypothetical protein